MTLSLWSLVGCSNSLHPRALVGNFLTGAASRFWHKTDPNEQGLRWRFAETLLKKRGSGSRVSKNKCQLFVSGSFAGRCDRINLKNRQVPVKYLWYHGWSSGVLTKRYLRFAIRASSSGGLGKKSSSKTKLHFVCENCGETFSQWWGTCQNCKEMNTLKEFRESVLTAGPRGGAAARALERINFTRKNEKVSVDGVQESKDKGAWLRPDSLRPQRLSDVVKGYAKQQWRLALPGDTGFEVSRVLGGGIVPGSLILVGGDPGVGKSTLLLQIAGLLALGCNDDPAPVLYISGEESVEQISDRADRMQIGAHELFLYSATDLELVLEAIQELKPRAVVVDSIQTVYLPEATGSAGSVSQVRECAAAMLRLAKQTSIPIFLVGHVTKTGDIAGPRVLEHIVDVVLYMEGERLQSHRLLRVVKNRYGSSDEVGVFEMVKGGLEAITNPSALFLSERAADSNVIPSAAVAVTMEGSRPILLEVQALCSSSSNQQGGRRTANGVDNQRLYLLLAVLMKQAGLKLQNQDVFINVVGGLQLREPASDVAVAIAICSSLVFFLPQGREVKADGPHCLESTSCSVLWNSFHSSGFVDCISYLDKPVPRDMAFIGEIGLGGEIRSVGQLERRITEAAKLGFKSCIVPRSAKGVVKNITATPCADIREVLERALGWPE